jgi:anti-anti-sigma factor
MANLHVLRFDGEIDVAQKQRFEQKLAAIGDFGPDSVVILDLSDAEYVDTTFLNGLIAVRNRALPAYRAGSILVVARPNNNVRRLLEITKFDDIFPVFERMDAAREFASA